MMTFFIPVISMEKTSESTIVEQIHTFVFRDIHPYNILILDLTIFPTTPYCNTVAFVERGKREMSLYTV